MTLSHAHRIFLKTKQPNPKEDELIHAFVESDLEKTHKLTAGQYFDYDKRKAENSGFSKYDVIKMKALEACHVFWLRYPEYASFYKKESKAKESITNLVIDKLPGLELKGYNRRRIITNQFSEIVSAVFLLDWWYSSHMIVMTWLSLHVGIRT